MSLRGKPKDVSDLPPNDVLKLLSKRDFALLAPLLERCDLPANEVLYHPGEEVSFVYFPRGSCLVSCVLDFPDGREVETMLVGSEGAVGPIIRRAYSRLVVKIGGPLVRIPVAELNVAKNKSTSIRDLFDRYAECLLAQAIQAAACNAVHSIEQRTAKWLSSVGSQTSGFEVPFTQDQLATVLGVGRSYATRVIQSLKAAGILETRRGAILVVDRAALEARSCHCDQSVKAFFAEVLGGA